MKSKNKQMTKKTITYNDTINPGDVIAVGDIHGRFDLLEKFLATVKDSGTTVIFLGDLIDRGPDDLKVLKTVSTLTQDPDSWGLQSVYALQGNHEQMFLNAVKVGGWRGSNLSLWLQNGGNSDSMSSMREYVNWLLDLPLYMTVGDTMFAHAGVFPGENPAVSIAEGRTEELIWMRQPFLTYGPQFELWTDKLNTIVFGHSPLKAPNPFEIPGGGIGIDSGAYFTGILTSYNATQKTLRQYHDDFSFSE